MLEDSITLTPDSLSAPIDSSNFLYCFPGDFSKEENMVISKMPVFQLQEDKISERSVLSGCAFIIFLICFIVTSRILSTKGRMFFSMFEELFRSKERKSIFFESLGHELYVKIFMIFQTIVLTSIFAYLVFINQYCVGTEYTLSDFFKILRISCIFLALFFLYKWLSYYISGKIFFNKEQLSRWIDNFSSLICILGVMIFIPVLFMFYIGWSYSFCYYFVLFCFLIVAIIVIYRSYMLFFHNKDLLLYLFLYLCAQEIAPLLIFHRALMYLT